MTLKIIPVDIQNAQCIPSHRFYPLIAMQLYKHRILTITSVASAQTFLIEKYYDTYDTEQQTIAATGSPFLYSKLFGYAM